MGSNCTTIACQSKPQKKKKATPRDNKYESSEPQTETSAKCSSLTDYNVVSLLGEGKEGEVFIAHHIATNTLRAVKSAKRVGGTYETNILYNALKKEGTILSSLKHPNIVKVFELVVPENTSPLLAMELCHGGSLLRKIKEGAIITERQIRQVSSQILTALCYLSSKNIAHKDIKPQNILFLHPNSLDNLKLADFGMADIREKGKYLHHSAGTPYYMAPEVYQRIFTEKCDVWSCGVIIYLLITGVKPFVAESKADLRKEVLYGEPNYDHPGFLKVTPECKDFVKKLIVKDDSKRLSADEALVHAWFSCSLKN